MPKKIYEGDVVSDKMDKTVVVAVTRLTHHPTYRKTVKKRVKFKAHDEENSCGQGDLVKIVQCRPISKTKAWRVVEILERAPQL